MVLGAQPAHWAGLRLVSQPDLAVSGPRPAVGTGSPRPGLSRRAPMVTGGQNRQLRVATNPEKPRSRPDQNGGSLRAPAMGVRDGLGKCLPTGQAVRCLAAQARAKRRSGLRPPPLDA